MTFHAMTAMRQTTYTSRSIDADQQSFEPALDEVADGQDYASLEDFLAKVRRATCIQLIAAERHGISSSLLVTIAQRMGVSVTFLAKALGISPSRAHQAIAQGKKIDGVAMLGLASLVMRAQELVEECVTERTSDFDAHKWFGHWLCMPQPALGGRTPAELMDTTTGRSIVLKTLGAMTSGAYL